MRDILADTSSSIDNFVCRLYTPIYFLYRLLSYVLATLKIPILVSRLIVAESREIDKKSNVTRNIRNTATLSECIAKYRKWHSGGWGKLWSKIQRDRSIVPGYRNARRAGVKSIMH